MTMVKRFMQQIESRGLHIKRGANPGDLVLTGPANERTPQVMQGLKAFRGDIVKIVWPEMDLPTEERPDTITDDPKPLPTMAQPQSSWVKCRQCQAGVDPKVMTAIVGLCPTPAKCPYRERYGRN